MKLKKFWIKRTYLRKEKSACLILSFIFLILLLSRFTLAYCPPYFVHIDFIENIENKPDCLSIEATTGCGGELYIQNYCEKKVAIYDENNQGFKKVIGGGSTLSYSDDKRIDYTSLGTEDTKDSKNWNIIFNYDDKNITVRGRTVRDYESTGSDMPYDLLFLFLLILSLFFLIVYVYTAVALMTIAKKTNTKLPWLAWIPIANFYLMTRIAKVPWWTMLIVVFKLSDFLPYYSVIPYIGIIREISLLVSLAVIAWWWWKIAEARNKPGWFGILTIIPFVNLVVIGVIAWVDSNEKSQKKGKK